MNTFLDIAITPMSSAMIVARLQASIGCASRNLASRFHEATVLILLKRDRVTMVFASKSPDPVKNSCVRSRRNMPESTCSQLELLAELRVDSFVIAAPDFVLKSIYTRTRIARDKGNRVLCRRANAPVRSARWKAMWEHPGKDRAYRMLRT
jgi:hypothetical protein